MKIEHIAMYVNDLEAAREFFIRCIVRQKNQLSNKPHYFTGDRHYALPDHSK